MHWSTICTLLYAVLNQAGISDASPFHSYRPAFDALLGSSPSVVVVAKSKHQLFHEGAVYHAPTKAFWVVSDKLDNKTHASSRDILRLTDIHSPSSTKIEYINNTIPNPIGGYRYISGTALGDVILFVAQGTLSKKPPAGIYAINPYPPYNSSLLLGSYGTYPFNSPDDVTVAVDGTIYISDPAYGYGQGSRPLPTLPNQVYSYNPLTQEVRVAADGFGQPNGVKASPDGRVLYIGDTGAQVGNGTLDLQGPRTIYAYDRVGKFLTNRRVFAMPQAFASAPDGIKTDTDGNVWSAVAGEGLYVWNAEGTLLGAIKLPTVVGNLGFAEPGELLVLGGTEVYKITLASTVVGA